MEEDEEATRDGTEVAGNSEEATKNGDTSQQASQGDIIFVVYFLLNCFSNRRVT